MIENNIFSCYIIGDDNITLQCADILLSNNHHLLGLISPSDKIKEWCAINHVHYFDSINLFQQKRDTKKFDFLFSIVNSKFLSKEVLSFPSYYAINYHDSPLPKYAGVYATSQAILHNEKQHAISWHIMEETVDTGNILKQPTFEIDASDTALSLNLKCYEHAIESFRELINGLATNTITPLKQNLSHRTYFGLKNKPKNLGFISWNQSSDNIDSLCRALTFGNYTNQLASPKIIINQEIFSIKSIKKLDISSGTEPGKIVHISSDGLQITTKTFDVIILELITLNGEKCCFENLANLFKLITGSHLGKINNDFIEKLSINHANNPRIEKFWFNEFLHCIHEEASFLSKLEKTESSYYKSEKKTKVPANLFKKINKLFRKNELENLFLTAALIYLFRLNNYKNLSTYFSNQELISTVYGIENFLSDHIPLTTVFNCKMTFLEALHAISTKKDQLLHNTTFTKDIFIRYPQIKNIPNEIEISINFVDSEEIKYPDKKLNLLISKDASWFCFKNRVNSKSHSKYYAYLKNMNKQFLTLLKDIIEYPNKNISQLSIIDKKEKTNILATWNNTGYEYNYKKLLHQYFEEQVKKTPDSIAVVFGEKSISYKELNEKANKLGGYLKHYGIKPNNLIGIALERSLEMVIGIFGILKAGGAYLPLDPNYPEERISYMLNDSKASLLITDSESIKNKPQGYIGKTIDINFVLNLDEFSNLEPKRSNKYSNLAYVIYTSGTTGKPKGVAISHRSICNHMVWMQNEYEFKDNDVFLQKTPFSFDASIWEFFAPLFIGAKLVIANKDAHASPDQLIHLIKKHQITILQLVPTMLKELLLTKGFKAIRSLRHVFSGGEALLSETIKIFFKNNPSHAKLHNLYGPTETTIEVITATCTKEDLKTNACRIGKPINNTKLYVLDDEMQPVPVGITGELYVAGEGLASGYLHNPVFTKQKFILNPFSDKKTDKLYKTGDLVKWQSDGNIEYLGRSDNQLKIRGFRIEMNEIEAHLMKIRAIHQCIVISEPNLDDSMSLSAYLVLEKNYQISAKDIRMILKKRIPEYMIPNRFFLVDKLLITPSGKVDRTILPKPYMQLDSGNNYEPPNNDIEKLLKNIWCSVLNTKNIGIHDDFFELGGNSLSAMKIISLIQDQFSISLSIRQLFQFTTINTLAKEIENTRHISDDYLNHYNLSENSIIPLKKTGKKSPLFLVHPIGGSVFWYKLLAKYFNEEQPLYGIQDPGIDKNKLIFDSLEEMACNYIGAVQTIQPHGPYLIGGASFGSTVAIEMARQLEEKGESITAIMSLDGWASYPTLQNNEDYFKEVMREQNSRIFKKYAEHNVYNSKFLLELQSHREDMLIKYKLPIIKAKFILFKAQKLNEIFEYNAPLNWWEDYTSQPIEFHLVPGDHESMFYEPNIKILASKLNDSLNEKSKENPMFSE